MKTLRGLGVFAFLSFLLVGVASAVIKPPRGGLFGASRQSDDALHAVDRETGTGQKIGDIVPGMAMGALAREPSTGILYGMAIAPSGNVLGVVDPQTGGVDDGAGGDPFIARLDPGAVVTDGDGNMGNGDEFLTFFSGADYGPDGVLYAAIGIFDPFAEEQPNVGGAYLATVDTDPVPVDIGEGEIVNFVNVTPIGELPATMTGISFDGDGGLWGVSPVIPLNPGLQHRLFEFGVEVDGTPDHTSVVAYPLSGPAATPVPPGGGFAALQFTCDQRLYAANLESFLYNIIEIAATYVGEGGYSNFTITYNDLDGDGLLHFDNDDIVSFSGIANGATWDTLEGVPAIFLISQASGFSAEGETHLWWVSDSGADEEEQAFLASDWTYSETITPVFALDGGQVFEIDTSTGNEGDFVAVNAGVSASGGAGMSGFAQATSCGVTTVEDAPTPAGSNVTVISIDSWEQVAYRVVTAGTTTATFCVGRDPREVVQRNGRRRSVQRFLTLSELSNTGTCGDITAGSDIRIVPWLRSYLGWVDLNGDGVVNSAKLTPPTLGGQEEEIDYWMVYANIDSTAVYEGPIAYLPFFDTLIDYTHPDLANVDHDTWGDVINPIDHCNGDLSDRPVGVGGTPVDGDPYANTEGDRAILQSIVCNRPGSITRRSEHAYPLKIDGNGNDERINMQWIISGIQRTILDAFAACEAPPATELNNMQSLLGDARNAIVRGRYLVDWEPGATEPPSGAVIDFESIAFEAKAADFSGCPAQANFQGNLMSRAESGAFVAFDRFFLPSIEPLPWQKYYVPAELEIPIHETRPASASPYPFSPPVIP